MIYGIAFLFEFFRNSAVSIDSLVLLEELSNICLFSSVLILTLLLNVVVVCASCYAG